MELSLILSLLNAHDGAAAILIITYGMSCTNAFCMILLTFLLLHNNFNVCIIYIHVRKATYVMQSSNQLICEIQPNKADNFFSFVLLLQSLKMLFLKLKNQLPNLHGVFTKLKLEYSNRKCQKKNPKKTKKRKFPLHTHFAFLHHITSQ